MSQSQYETKSDNILLAGTHMGYDYQIKHNGIGFRCGYVLLPKDHPWSGKHYDVIKCGRHGGLTYTNESDDGRYAIGFDCAHCFDGIDPSLPNERREDMELLKLFEKSFNGQIKDNEYVRKECEKIIEQAIEANNENLGGS